MTEAASTNENAAESDQTRSVIVFYNLHLTISPDFVQVVRRACGADQFINLDLHPDYQAKRPFNRDFFQDLMSKEATLRGVTAHRMVPDIHMSPDLKVLPIVFLRQPLLHALALYDASRNRGDDWPGKELVMSLDAAQWIDWSLEPEQKGACKNFQSCLLSIDGDGRMLPPRGRQGILDKPGFYGRIEELDASETAKLATRRGRLLLVQERLDAMPVVCVAEQLDKSLHLLNQEVKRLFKAVRLSRPRSMRSGATTDWRQKLRNAERSLPPDTLSRFYDANEDDLLLWERYFAKMTWADPVSYHTSKAQVGAEAPVAGGSRSIPRPTEPIPGLDDVS